MFARTCMLREYVAIPATAFRSPYQSAIGDEVHLRYPLCTSELVRCATRFVEYDIPGLNRRVKGAWEKGCLKCIGVQASIRACMSLGSCAGSSFLVRAMHPWMFASAHLLETARVLFAQIHRLLDTYDERLQLIENLIFAYQLRSLVQMACENIHVLGLYPFLPDLRLLDKGEPINHYCTIV